jgi:REP element-mobilizing transposase RayT
MPLAYFITFSTYGTRLHGSDRGSVDKEHKEFGTPLLEADAVRENEERAAMEQPPYVMRAPERDIVCKAIVTLAAERGWVVLAIHVRSTHVHVVIQTEERDPGRTMSDLKGRASRDLNRAGFDSSQRRRWTRHGSTKHLFHEDKVEAAIHYTLDEQGERMTWYAIERSKAPRTK